MDVISLTKFLVPFLPILMNVGNKVFDGAIAKVGEDVWDKAKDKAKAIWAKLQPKLETKPMVKGAAEELANSPKDADALDTLQKQLKKLLDEDKTLALQIADLMQSDEEVISKVVNTFNQIVPDNDNVIQNVTGGSNKFIGKVGGDATIN